MKFRVQILGFFLAAAALASSTHAQQHRSIPPTPEDRITIDASTPIPPPETGYLHLGGTSSTGHSLQVNSRYLVLDGKPWLPVMGELHYSRLPESEWEDEILKMKAAGIDIISTYVIWIHHEEIEGSFDWTGRRDLRHFVELCAKHHMYVWLRPGPWDHGEVRNGGFPDWLNKLPNTRTNDPTYLHYVDRFFRQIATQGNGFMFKDGGPVIGTQLENEYSLHGPGRGAEHILKLKQLALAAGIDPPLFSVTGWPSLDFPPQEVLPVSGGYPDGFWYGSQTNLPPSITYLFNFNRELGDMGATVPSEDSTGKVHLEHDPYLAAEEGGGMATAYHRRPVLSADDIAALTLTGIGSGMNLYGYYMFHGGTNPHGRQTTLEESQATGFPNDLPQYTYDFQAPLGEFGQQRDSYSKTRLLHLFLNAYGPELAPMAAFAPAHHSRDPADTSTPRVAVRSNGTSGFLFVNNYARQLPMPARPHFQVDINLPTGHVLIPQTPIDIPANTYFAWPFHLALGDAVLTYSTTQLLTRLTLPDGHRLVVFYALPGIPAEFSFDPNSIAHLTASTGHINRSPSATTIRNLTPGLNSTIDLEDDHGTKTTLLLLTKPQAEQVSLIDSSGQSHLLLTASTLLFDGSSLRLRSTASPTQHLSTLPALSLASGSPKQNGLWTTYTFTQPEQHPTLAISPLHPATLRATMEMGPYVDWRKGSVPTVPPDSAFAEAATWHLTIPHPSHPGIHELLLDIHYTGDIARLTSPSGNVLDDHFFNGLPWQVGLLHLGPDESTPSLTLQILPMPSAAPIYLDPSARKLLAAHPHSATLTRVKLIPEYESQVRINP